MDSPLGPASFRSGPVRVAVVQAAPILFDTPRTLQKLADLAADAAGRGAELVVFPEALVGGYPKGHDFGVRLGVRTPDGRDQFRRYFESAVEAPGPATEPMNSVAREHRIHLVVGLIERAGGTLYCTAAIFGPDGALLGKHRKLVPTAMERVVWGRGDGSTLPVIDTPVGKVGAVISWENYMPLLRTAMYAKGVELYCAVTVDDGETWVPTVRHIALEGRCFVLSACQFVRRADLPPDYPATQDVLIRGGSCIVGPLGELLAGPVYSEECVLTADLDRADLGRPTPKCPPRINCHPNPALHFCSAERCTFTPPSAEERHSEVGGDAEGNPDGCEPSGSFRVRAEAHVVAEPGGDLVQRAGEACVASRGLPFGSGPA